jgi:sec-independent protein translocase protein TatB
MFGLSLGHLFILGIIVLIFVGPEQLPEVARTIARVLNELRRATTDFQRQFTSNLDVNKWEEHLRQQGPPTQSQARGPEVVQTAEEPVISGHGYPDQNPTPDQAHGESPSNQAPASSEEKKS